MSRQQYAALLDATDDVIFLLDRDQRYVGIWGRWISEHELDPAAFQGMTTWELFDEDSRDYFESLNERVMAGRTVSYERWFDVPWGERVFYHTVLSPFRDEAGEIVGIVGVGRDLTELEEARGQLEHMATHDPLTDLPNRLAFQNAVERASARAMRGMPSALLFADVDEFKTCNDQCGHAAGDEVLMGIARALRNRVREPDIVARIGGDEFGIVLEGAGLDIARNKAQELRDAVRAYGERFGFDFDLSVGITSITAGAQMPEVLARADRAMYEAKNAEDVQVVVSA